ncbi:hypothetical protein KY337_03810 [Candidatus Woesearchaeota archaeon]|nr:hypothetical protein [Candidatus Woesearchaeota archaeon]
MKDKSIKIFDNNLRRLLRKIGLYKTPKDIKEAAAKVRKDVMKENKEMLIKLNKVRGLKIRHSRQKNKTKKALKKSHRKIKRKVNQHVEAAGKKSKKLIKELFPSIKDKEKLVRKNLRKAATQIKNSNLNEAEHLYYEAKDTYDKLPDESKLKLEKDALKLYAQLSKALERLLK